MVHQGSALLGSGAPRKSPARRAFFIAALTAAICAAASCRALQDAREIEANILSPGNFRAGSGVIESIAPIAGRSRVWLLSLRMDGSGYQAVEVDYGGYISGEFVELTNDGRVVRVTGTSLKNVIRK